MKLRKKVLFLLLMCVMTRNQYTSAKKIITSIIDYYTDFTMKIRCKDGRAKIACF